ncbi:MAG: flotillin-like FloA family protein, partial [Oscillospiraceae bacterium]|nr:flotillin-like FloA family protein [Oscillospiraceae bacterium]
REGKLGVMDYYQLQNTIADTDMRESLSQAARPGSSVEPGTVQSRPQG